MEPPFTVLNIEASLSIFNIIQMVVVLNRRKKMETQL